MKSIRIKTIRLTAFILLALVLLPAYTSAQLIPERKANELFENFSFSTAAEIYERLYQEQENKSKYIQRLAYCYEKMLNYPKALKFYSLLVQLEECKTEDYYKYAQLLQNNGNLGESKIWFGKYIAQAPDDQRAIIQLENISSLLKMNSNPGKIRITNLKGNTRFIDMCPVYYKDRLVYSSAKDSSHFVRNRYEWNNQPFLDLYVSDQGSNPNLNDDVAFPTLINTRFHEGPACFTSDCKTIYFTRNSFIDGKIYRTKEGVNNLKIFIADYYGNEWRNIRNLPFNSDSYSVAHPALSPDNRTIYFVSDMPGGFGETDIYKSNWMNGAWSRPQNLGASINTKGKEMFPFLDNDGILYFASNGQPGMGGLDIFAAKTEENDNYYVVNLVSPINSPYDDFGYVVKKDSMAGYFTSNRPGGKGEDDIYSFSIDKINLRVLSYDENTRKTIPGSKISLLGEDGHVIDSKLADQDGAAEFSVKPGQKCILLVENKTYQTGTKEIRIKNSLFDFKQNEELFLKQNFTYLTIEIKDKESGLIIPDALVSITEGKYDQSQMEKSEGTIRMKINESTDYSFNATAKEYFENTAKYSYAGKVPGEYLLSIELERISAGKQFVLDDLFYDLNKYNIRPDAALVLDKLLNVLLDNPEVRISIGSHTDCRATAEYNRKLSQKRSESVVAYLISKGIDPARLEAKGYGESELINRCADGVTCSELEHQANRRTVVEVLNMEIRNLMRNSKNVFYF